MYISCDCGNGRLTAYSSTANFNTKHLFGVSSQMIIESSLSRSCFRTTKHYNNFWVLELTRNGSNW